MLVMPLQALLGLGLDTKTHYYTPLNRFETD